MIDQDKLEESDETYEGHEVYRFEPEEHSWEDVYELGVELEASKIGRTSNLKGETSSYFISLTY